ncbi:MAG: family 16 glycosylhydrolase [Rikenellaceae bacterium]
MNKKFKTISVVLLAIGSLACSSNRGHSSVSDVEYSYNIASDPRGYVDSLKWRVVWSDEFDYDDSLLEKLWVSDSGTYKSQIACTRFRENAVVSDGSLKLINRREDRDPRTEWTSGNIWSRETFLYGFFECRYKYAAAHTTNNAFWIMPSPATPIPEDGIKFEIDINEGHYPNELYLDLHNWSEPIMIDGVQKFPRDQRCYAYGGRSAVSIDLAKGVTTSKIRLSSSNKRSFNLTKFEIIDAATGVDLVSNDSALISVSGVADGAAEAICFDSELSTWRAPLNGEKWIQFEFCEARDISAVNFESGNFSTQSNMVINSMSNYLVEAWDGLKWVKLDEWDVSDTTNFADTFHTYGLEWNKEELIYYFDGVEIRREPNEICHNEANVYLSLAILKYLGDIPDNVDGSFMEVDYVRIYKNRYN